MEKEKVIAWLDRKIEADKIMREEEGNLRICSSGVHFAKEGVFPTLHVYNCIDEIAQSLEEPVLIEKQDDSKYPYFRYIIYNGYIIFDISETEDGE